jgi:hypothetical protein
LEQCSGVSLSQERSTISDEEAIANQIMNDLLGFELGNGDITNLTQLGDFLNGAGSAQGKIDKVLTVIQDAVAQHVAAGRLTSNDQTNINGLVGTIRNDLNAGLPGGPSQLVGELNGLATALEGLSFAGNTAESATSSRVFDVIGAVLGSDADLLNAVSNRDLNGTRSSYDNILTAISDLQNDCNGVSSGVLDNPVQAVQDMLDASNLPLVGQLYSALGGQLGNTPFSSVVTSLINGNFTQFGGVNGLQTLLSGGPLDTLRNNLTLLGNLTGPLAGLSGGGLPALSQITDPESTLPGFTDLFNLIPVSGGFGLGGTALSSNQVGTLVSGLLDTSGGPAQITTLTGILNGGNVLGNLPGIGTLLGGLL